MPDNFDDDGSPEFDDDLTGTLRPRRERTPPRVSMRCPTTRATPSESNPEDESMDVDDLS